MVQALSRVTTPAAPANGRKYRGFPKLGVPFGGPYNKDYSILGSILGSPYFRKLPYSGSQKVKGAVLKEEILHDTRIPDMI